VGWSDIRDPGNDQERGENLMTAGLVAFFVVITVLLIFYALFAPTNVTVSASPSRPGAAGNSTFDRWVRPAIRNFLPQTPLAMTEYARKSSQVTAMLARTGNPWRVSPEEYVAVRILAAAAGAMFFVLISVSTTAEVPLLLALLIGGMVGYMAPQAILSGEWAKRRRDISLTLPEALDLLRICMNAGYNFTNGLQQTVELLPKGVTQLELSRVLAELRAGKSVVAALTSFAYRCPTEGVESFVRAISQAQSTGVDIASTLSYQAEETRADYERNVDVRSQKLQTTLFFPIIGLLIPVLMIILFAPAVTGLQGAF
jgi:tight adherence protein C